MRRKVQKWGNSLAIRIPKPFASEIGLQQNSAVDISVADGQLIVSLAEVPSYTLEGLLSGVTQDNLHSEVFSGPRVGNEVW